MNEYKILFDALNEKSMQFTAQEVFELMNTELQKEPGEMDTELVELCIDVLDKNGFCADTTVKESDVKKSSNKKIKLGRVLLIAAIFAVVLAIAIPVGAKFVHINASDDVVKYQNNHFSVNLQDADSVEAVINNFVLPKALISDDCSIFDVEEYDIETVLYFKNNNSDIYGNIIIRHNDGNDFYSGQGEASNDYHSVEEMNVNNIKVLVIESNDLNTIMYIANDNEYIISLRNCSFEVSKEIANTIGEK